MKKIYQSLWSILNIAEKKKFILLIFLMIFMAFFEVLGVGSIMPFLSVVADKEIIETNKYLQYLYMYFNFTSDKSFLIFLGLCSIFILFISTVLKSLTSYALFRFANLRRHSVGKKLLKKYLYQSYSFFLMRNSSEVTKTILSETDVLIDKTILPAIRLIPHSLVSLFLITFLLFINIYLALILIGMFGLFYITVYMLIRKYLTRIGKERVESNSSRFKFVSETIGGIKEVKVLGKEDVYLDKFNTPSRNFSIYSATAKTLSQVPQYLMEFIAFGSLLGISIYGLSYESFNLNSLLPIFGLYAMSALKLKPAISEVYKSLTAMKFGDASLTSIMDDLVNLEIRETKTQRQKLSLKKNLVLRNISFSYSSNTNALSNLNIEINANTTVGIIGTTGAGKSTLVDLVLGLLIPTQGEIFVDGKILTRDNIRDWQNSIGYVPQAIFMVDESIKNNIAFGVPNNEIDLDKIEEVCKMAQIDTFIKSLENGYDTLIGERGVRISGGQKQRIGIARALYKNPELLILDEATSALDTITESEVMKSIENMSGKKTIIMIAHRLSTIEKCDVVIKMENGRIIS